MRRVGRPGIPPTEVERRRAIAARVTSWAEYGRLVGVRNPKLDSRLGVRLLCSRCRRHLSVAPKKGTLLPGGRQHPLCGRCMGKVARQ